MFFLLGGPRSGEWIRVAEKRGRIQVPFSKFGDAPDVLVTLEMYRIQRFYCSGKTTEIYVHESVPDSEMFTVLCQMASK